MVYIVGGVASHKEGFSSLNDMWGLIIFHAVVMILGSGAITKAVTAGRSMSETSSEGEGQ